MMRAKSSIAYLLGALAISASGVACAQTPLPAPEAYCRNQGGVVQIRVPEYGTNGGVRLVLAGEQGFCQFTSATDGSSISVLLLTLTTPKPTLAALAYYAESPLNPGCRGGPGSCYCAQVGGTDAFGGISAAGGGWVLKNNQTDVLDSCIFPDESSIDSYGLFYHSAGIVRGADLTGILRYPSPYAPRK